MNLYAHVRFLFVFAHETSGAARGLPCALIFVGRMNLQNSGEGCRENADAYPAVTPALSGRPSIPERS
jgi:hypothetical protein